MSEQEKLLRKLRGHMAYKKQVEPFRVFRDIELNLLLEKEPKDIESLTQIKGFPANGARVKGYGEAIIAIFNNTSRVKSFSVKLDANGECLVTTILKPLEVF